MTILVTGTAGFIGSALALKLLEEGCSVVGIDNHNDYYDLQLKEVRVKRHANFKSYTQFRADIADLGVLKKVFELHLPKKVLYFAAQGGYGTF